MEDALEIYNLKMTKEEMGDKQKYREIKKEDIRKPQKILQEMNLVEGSIVVSEKWFIIDCPGHMKPTYNGREVRHTYSREEKKFIFFSNKVLELVGGRSVIHRATPSSLIV